MAAHQSRTIDDILLLLLLLLSLARVCELLLMIAGSSKWSIHLRAVWVSPLAFCFCAVWHKHIHLTRCVCKSVYVSLVAFFSQLKLTQSTLTSKWTKQASSSASAQNARSLCSQWLNLNLSCFSRTPIVVSAGWKSIKLFLSQCISQGRRAPLSSRTVWAYVRLKYHSGFGQVRDLFSVCV